LYAGRKKEASKTKRDPKLREIKKHKEVRLHGVPE